MDKQKLVTFAQDLIRARSISGEEQTVVKRIAAEMQAIGFDDVWVDELGSVTGWIQGDKPGKTLLLDGHCDTVDAIPSDWKHDPFAAVIEDGYLYGRGIADMKGPIAGMVYGAASVDRSKLAGKVAVCATVLEEVMEGVAIQHIMNELKPDAVIIGESTDFTLNHAGRGRVEIVIETFGRSAHSSHPQAGLCSVHEMMRVMQAVEAIPMPSHPAMGSAQMCLTDIVSTPFPGHSVVPNRCRVSYDHRSVPGETPESIINMMNALPDLEDVQYTVKVLDGEEKTYTGKTVRGLKFFPAWALEKENPLVVAAMSGLKNSGFTPKLGAYRFCTNGAYSAGLAGVPTIGFGPGKEQDAHTVDERMKVSDIERAADGYLGMIQAILS